MAIPQDGPPLKRPKLDHTRIEGSGDFFSNAPLSSSPPVDRLAESSFIFEPLNRRDSSSPVPSQDYVLDITNYIPVGCIRLLKKNVQISSGVWESQDFWAALTIPRDVYNKKDHPFLLNAVQDLIMTSPTLNPYQVLLNSGMIRMEFKTKDTSSGQVRVYILREDVGRDEINREQRTIRKALRLLLREIDISSSTWDGCWTNQDPVAHIDPSLNEQTSTDDEVSLFSLFNALSSPIPDTAVVKDGYAKEAMGRIIDNDVHGLKTLMYSFQTRAAAMMLQREVEPGRIIDPRLRQLRDQKGLIWYCDPDTGFLSREPRMYEAARGGILAENMGLGKTLICLVLILATRDLPSQIPPELATDLIPIRKSTGSLLDMAAATIGRNALPWKIDLAIAEAQGMEFVNAIHALHREAGHYYLPNPEPLRSSRHATTASPRKLWLSTSTLVVVPPNLIQQWCGEIRKHTTGLKVLVLKDFKQIIPPAKELLEFDIILFSKTRFEKEAKGVVGCGCVDSKCACQEIYRCPLRDIHFKRLIFDEGHTIGNSSNSAQTDAFTVVNALQVSTRWVVSGTPTQGLYGVEGSQSENSSEYGTPSEDPDTTPNTPSSISRRDLLQEKQRGLFYQQERNDLVKLGNIATHFLKARPWASSSDGDVALWSQHVMLPQHGQKSRGNVDCLTATLQGMIIRHRPTDVILDVDLPPLTQTTVYLEGCLQNKIALNVFNMMIITNAVTSERKDADYFFHPKQRKHLHTLVSNLRQASFFWSGFEMEHIGSTIENAQTFLEKAEIPISTEDTALLKQVLELGEVVLSNGIYGQISRWHEMPMFIENNCPDEVREALSLGNERTNPTLVGATMLHDAQKFVESQAMKDDTTQGLVMAAQESLSNARKALLWQAKSPGKRTSSTKGSKRSTLPDLAGGVTVGDDSTPRKRPAPKTQKDELIIRTQPSSLSDETASGSSIHKVSVGLKSGLKATSSPLDSARLVSTASTKLSYLMDRIIAQEETEKILVFYESDTVAYYIAQALECLNIKHLIYAKELRSDLRSRYVVAFNNTETFRVLLMDVSQAAFGLDLSSASRVYFVNPVFSPHVEAQAIKRAHRIGQLKPVFVETLVLKGSIEEVLINRRNDLSSEEHNKCKSILDDQTMYAWIRNVKFLDMPKDDISPPEQMAKLATPQRIFGTGAGSRINREFIDAELAVEMPAENKTKAKARFAPLQEELEK